MPPDELDAPAESTPEDAPPAEAGNDLLDSVRFDGIDEKPDGPIGQFWDEESKAFQMNKLNDAFKETQTLARQKAPEAPDKYELNLPDSLKEGLEGDDDVLLVGFQQVAKEMKLSQEQFDGIVTMFGGISEQVMGDMPSEESRDSALESVYGQRVPATKAALERFIDHVAEDQAMAEAVKRGALDPTVFRFLNRARNSIRTPAMPTTSEPTQPEPSNLERFHALLKDPEFLKGDAAKVQEVNTLRMQLEAQQQAQV